MNNIKEFLETMVQTNQNVTIYTDDKSEGGYFFILTAQNRDWVEIEVQTEGAHPDMVEFADKLFLDGVNVNLNSSDVPPSALGAIMLALLTRV